jgi:hypothetical protein
VCASFGFSSLRVDGGLALPLILRLPIVPVSFVLSLMTEPLTDERMVSMVGRFLRDEVDRVPYWYVGWVDVWDGGENAEYTEEVSLVAFRGDEGDTGGMADPETFSGMSLTDGKLTLSTKTSQSSSVTID